MNVYHRFNRANRYEHIAQFIGLHQARAMAEILAGEEGEWMRDTLIELNRKIGLMPKTYQQDGAGDEAIAHLHYFYGGCDWWITEKDQEPEQLQAFGLVQLNGWEPELGYIDITEVKQRAEIDLHWTPKTLREIRAHIAQRQAAA